MSVCLLFLFGFFIIIIFFFRVERGKYLDLGQLPNIGRFHGTPGWRYLAKLQLTANHLRFEAGAVGPPALPIETRTVERIQVTALSLLVT